MRLRQLSALLIVVVATGLLLILTLAMRWFAQDKAQTSQWMNQSVQTIRQQKTLAVPLVRRVIAAPPQEIPAPPATLADRYRVRNPYPVDRSKPLPLYLIDTVTSQATRLGDDSGEALYQQARNDRYLLWWFGCASTCPTWRNGLHAHIFATGEDRFVAADAGGSRPKLYNDWVAYPTFYGGLDQAKLVMTNLASHELITFTTEVFDPLGNSEHIAIGDRLVAWVTNPRAESITQITPATLKIYDLAARTPITTIIINQSTAPTLTLYSYTLAANETVVTWGPHYGYDTVTGSFFTVTLTTKPWRDWDGKIVEVSPITEQDRMLYWNFQMKDATRHYFKAPLIDATPSAAPCIEGQNLVQNGDLEDIAAHNLWQQSGSPSDLIVNDLPPNAPQAGQWAIRLGRYSNAQQTIQQTLNIPSNVKHITLAFDVRANSWDIWGGDQLQVDLIDPVTNQSILVTPVQWTNRQLANGGWVPLQVDVQDWPGIDTPLYLVFRATTDWAFPTDFSLEHIRFMTSCH